MSMDENEMEQVACFMGHTKKTHAEFYRLPQDIYQTAKVAKVLLLLEKGKGKEFQGKNLNDIELEEDVYYSSESEPDDEEVIPIANRALRRTLNHEINNSKGANDGSEKNDLNDSCCTASTSKDNDKEIDVSEECNCMNLAAQMRKKIK